MLGTLYDLHNVEFPIRINTIGTDLTDDTNRNQDCRNRRPDVIMRCARFVCAENMTVNNAEGLYRMYYLSAALNGP